MVTGIVSETTRDNVNRTPIITGCLFGKITVSGAERAPISFVCERQALRLCLPNNFGERLGIGRCFDGSQALDDLISPIVQIRQCEAIATTKHLVSKAIAANHELPIRAEMRKIGRLCIWKTRPECIEEFIGPPLLQCSLKFRCHAACAAVNALAQPQPPGSRASTKPGTGESPSTVENGRDGGCWLKRAGSACGYLWNSFCIWATATLLCRSKSAMSTASSRSIRFDIIEMAFTWIVLSLKRSVGSVPYSSVTITQRNGNSVAMMSPKATPRHCNSKV